MATLKEDQAIDRATERLCNLMTANELSTRNLVRLQPLIDWQLAKHLNGIPYTNV